MFESTDAFNEGTHVELCLPGWRTYGWRIAGAGIWLALGPAGSDLASCSSYYGKRCGHRL